MRFCLGPSFGMYSSVYLFGLIFCSYFYVLGSFFTFLHVGNVSLCRDYLRDPAAPSPLVTRAIYSRGVPYIGCMGPSVCGGAGKQVCW